jgi:hypothetical protein
MLSFLKKIICRIFGIKDTFQLFLEGKYIPNEKEAYLIALRIRNNMDIKGYLLHLQYITYKPQIKNPPIDLIIERPFDVPIPDDQIRYMKRVLKHHKKIKDSRYFSQVKELLQPYLREGF